ncbi:ABC transporter substrate-binding protein [Modestobacter sp. VKM Ac-2986]|uniref:ABC transporter substrate-binding protein n=1 Tax=Modestobacter sp. VKM Ac-2986 TaxID=3004140 RepID=UPI0022AA6605|nr:ABC transporter substrate-binding protein [Modestobacter sp. VKM Ac-2986]
MTAACGGGAGADAAGAPSTVSIGYAYAPETFDPMYANAGAQVSAHMHAIYGALIERDAQGVERPGMAESWEWEDAQTLRFDLRPGVKFTDGEDYDAEAVKKWLDYGRTAEDTPYSNLDAIENVVVVDPLTVRLELSRPDPRLTKFFVGHMGAVPSPAALDSGDLGIHPVGAGPYTLDEGRTTTDNTYTYVKNPDYWDAARFDHDELVIKIYTDANAMYNALVSGQVDVGYGNGSNFAAAQSTDLEVFSQPQNANGIALYDLAGANVPALASKEVRQALNWAVDRKTIIDTVFQGQGTPSALAFTPGSGPGYDESLLDHYGYDPAKAKSLLAQGGYPDGFSFSAVTLSKDQPMAEAVAGYLGEVGVQMELIVRPPGETANTDIGKYDAAAVALGLADSFATPPNLWLGPATANNQRGFEAPEIRALYDKAVMTTGEEQAALMDDIAAAAVEGAYSVQVGYVNSLTYYDPDKVTNIMVLPGHGGPYILEGLDKP